MWTKIKTIERKIADITDKYFVMTLLYIALIVSKLSMFTYGLLEDYIYNRGYSYKTQFERALSDEAIYRIALSIHSTYGWTWKNVTEHVYEWSDKTIFIGKRQAYKILFLSREMSGETKDKYKKKYK